MDIDNSIINTSNIERLHNKICEHIDNARKSVQRCIDTEMVKAYFLIGREIVEEEQKGQERAEYGSYLLEALSKKLTARYNRGFSISTLKTIRKFYLAYHDYEQIGYALRTQSANDPIHRGSKSTEQFSSKLGWIHYRALMRVSRPEARRFYAIEAEKNNWSGRELERQINSLLFDRLVKSKDQAGLMKLANSGHEINTPEDAIKDPIILEFLDIPESNKLVESKLEEALISNIQHFLLELGKGFAFVARQKRLTLDGDHFYADLVFYHVILKCYIIIDIKVKKLLHADLGQMQLYVNYFDQKIRAETDNPTIGLILCTEKNNEMVRYTLGEKAQQIFASKYQFHLPTEKELAEELKREIQYIKEHMSVDE